MGTSKKNEKSDEKVGQIISHLRQDNKSKENNAKENNSKNNDMKDINSKDNNAKENHAKDTNEALHGRNTCTF